MTFINWLEGKKTYIVGVLAAVYAVLVAFGYINFTPDQETAINLLVLALFGMTLRNAIK
jgi:hypothetical protein